MHPRHFAMFAVPAHGHVNPSLAVIRELSARGHRVTYAVTEQFEGAVAAAGATPVVYETTWPTTPQAAREQWSGDLVETFRWFSEESMHVLPQLAAAYADDVPDLVLYDIGAYHARVLAHRWGVPLVQLSPAYVAWEGYEQEIAPALAAVRETDAYRAYERDFADWLAQDGITLSIDEFVGRPPRSLVLLPRALQPNAERVDETRYTFVGPAVNAGREEAAWEGPADGSRVLLISLGSAFTEQPAFYRACLEAFGDLDGWHVVLSIGSYVEPDALGQLPANVELHRFAPQLAVMERASAFVTHAGMGSAKEGLAAGVPMIAVPQAVDQFGNADRLVELGVARRFATEDATPQALRAALLELTGDPQVQECLAQLRREIAQEGGTPRAADLLEAQLAA